MNNNDMHISGSGTIASGDYGAVRISGSGKIVGDVTCTELHSSGSGHAKGDIRCSGAVKCSGSFHGDGEIEAGSLGTSGTFHCEGRIEAGKAVFSGSAKLRGGISAEEIVASGSVSAADMEAERIVVSGGCDVDGLMNAESIELNLGGGCRVGSIGCGRLKVRAELFGHVFSVFSTGGRFYRLTVGTIEGDSIEIENTTADTILGANIIVGKNCHIGRVEYSGTLTVDPSAEVKEQQHL